jgi:predicted  nucleic acid-binding Zn-ribbon protein
MRQRLSEMKEMEQDVVRLERELEEKKHALQESKQSVNFFRKDMVRMQITVEDIDSRETSLRHAISHLLRSLACIAPSTLPSFTFINPLWPFSSVDC